MTWAAAAALGRGYGARGGGWGHRRRSERGSRAAAAPEARRGGGGGAAPVVGGRRWPSRGLWGPAGDLGAAVGGGGCGGRQRFVTREKERK
jgi:hypothetical protein